MTRLALWWRTADWNLRLNRLVAAFWIATTPALITAAIVYGHK